jgi:hypothetical protein
MAWRKWLVRGGCYSTMTFLALGGLAWMCTTQPEVVRQIVQDNLRRQFHQVHVSIQSAQAHLLGGVSVQELRLGRNDSLDRTDILYVPRATIYHDKEKLFGEIGMGLRKVEMIRPQLRIIRERDGQLNLSGILGPPDLSVPVPTLVLRQGTILLEDRVHLASGPLLEIKNAQLTVINDPLPTLHLEGSGEVDVLGPIRFRATIQRATFATRVHFDLPEIPLGPVLLERLAGFCPELMSHLRQLQGKGSVQVDLTHDPNAPQPLHHEIEVKLRQGSWGHPQLPHTFEQIEAEARCVDGVVPRAQLTARWGTGTVALTLEDLVVPTTHRAPGELLVEDLVRNLELRIERFTLTPEALAKLPPELAWVETNFKPAGPVSLNFVYHQPGPGPLVKQWHIQLQGVEGCFNGFPYPLEGVTGSIDFDASRADDRHTEIDLRGRGGACPVQIRGHVTGPRAAPGMAIDITGVGLRLDDKVLAALHPSGQKVALQFLSEASRQHGLATHPMGYADIHAAVRRPAGQSRYQNVYTILFKQSSVKADLFPYPLEDVTGTLTLYPDHWECKGFRGTHAGGVVLVDGYSVRLPPPAPPQSVVSRQSSVVRSQEAATQVVQAVSIASPINTTTPLTPPAVPPPVPAAADRTGWQPLPPGSVPAPVQPSAPSQIRLFIRGQEVLLDRDFEQALAPASNPERKPLQNAWQTLVLTGRMNFAAEVVDDPHHPGDLTVGVDVERCTMKPAFFGYALSDVCGSVRYSRGKVLLGNVKARHGNARLGIRWGQLQLKPGGGFLGWLKGIEGAGLVPDEELLVALPEGMRKILEPLGLGDPLQVHTELTLDTGPGPGSPLKVWWDGKAILNRCSFRAGVEAHQACGEVSCRGYHDGTRVRGVTGNLLFEQAILLGQPVQNISARLEVAPDTPDAFSVRHLKADLFGGTVCGEARLRLGPVFSYEVWLEVLRLQLDQFGKHNLGASASKAQLSGPARAFLYLTGEGSDLLGLKGSGRVDVDNGKMGQLPLLLDLVKAFGLQVPDRTAFVQAHLLFTIEGPQIQVRELALSGNAISLWGQGTVDLDGDHLNLDFSATPGRMRELLPAGLDLIPPAISEQILKIKMRGHLGKADGVRFDKSLVPALTEPLERVMGTRIDGR